MLKLLRNLFSFSILIGTIKVKVLGLKISFKIGSTEIALKYEDMITTINYFSKQFTLDKKLINRIKFHSKYFFNKKTLIKDKSDLQKHFDSVLVPSKIRPASGLLRVHQMRLLETAKEIVHPLEKENIRCTMNGGFLIGALRHGGFIPWDDDADFDLVRSDYDRFVSYVKKTYLYADSSECRDFRDFWYMMNDCLKKNPNKIIFTDLRGYLQAYRGISAGNHITIDFIPWEFVNPKVTVEEYDKWRYKFAKIIRNYKLTWGELANIYRNEINTNKIFVADEKDCNIYRNFGGYGILYPKSKNFININTFYPCKKLKFEDTEFFAANDYEKYLALDFKDYKKIPASIGYAKFIKSINQTSRELFNEEYYINYEDLING